MKALPLESTNIQNFGLFSTVGRSESNKNFVAGAVMLLFCGAFDEVLLSRVRLCLLTVKLALKCAL